VIPSEEYVLRLSARELRVAYYEKIHIRVGNVRLVLVVILAFMAWATFKEHALSG